MRKIIQIAGAPETNGAYQTLVALCDDGTLWETYFNRKWQPWAEIPGVPQPAISQMLEAVADFQRPDYVMTDAEAQALSDTTNRNRPKIPAKSLPGHRNDA